MSENKSNLLLGLMLVYGLSIFAFGIYISVKMEFIHEQVKVLELKLLDLDHEVLTINRNQIKRNEKNIAVHKAATSQQFKGRLNHAQ